MTIPYVRLLVLSAATFLLYSLWLDYSPVYLHEVEISFAIHSIAIARTLHDANGRWMPLYFQMPSIGENVWFHPMIVYFSALILKVFAVSTWSVRLPSVLIGIVNVVLMYLLALRVFPGNRWAWISAMLLALTPAHFIHSRIGMDYIYPLPFVLTWLLCLLEFDRTGERLLVFGAVVALGFGFYSYIASIAMMPLYLFFTLVFIFAKYRGIDRAHVVAIVGFCLPLIVFAVWIRQHPTVYGATTVRYGITRLGPLQGLRELLTYNSIQEHLSLYWDFNNPTYLFFAGGSNMANSTRRAGVFLLPLALFLPAGLYDVTTKPATRTGWLFVAGFLSAPIPAVLVRELYAIDRELAVLPFAVLVATIGVRRLLTSSQSGWRIAAVVALTAVPFQFAYFAKDYFTDYRLNSNAWFGGNIRGAVLQLLDQDRQRTVPAVYLSSAIPYAKERYQFYLIEAHREDMLSRADVFEANAAPKIVPRGMVVVPFIDGVLFGAHVLPADLRKVAVISEPDGTPSFALLQR